ncbi:MAG: TetR/AcrR family transcriptional regulator [Allomuricauda sp.]
MPRAKQFNEEEILIKAMELFWEKGFHATSMQDLVSHLGINRASLYDTFGGKEELFNQAFSHYRSGASDMLRSLFEKAPSVKAGFQQLFDMSIKESMEDPFRKGCFVVNTTTELIPGDGELLQILNENKSNMEHFFTQCIQKGIARGEFHKDMDAESVAAMLFTLYSGMRVVAKVDPDPIRLKKMMDTGLSILDH